MKILLSEGSSTSARGALYALGPHHTIDIVDANPLCQCRFSKYVRRWHRCPRFGSQPEQYLSFLLDLLRNEQYDVLLPTHEQVYLIARYQEQIQQFTHLAVPPFASIDRAIGKADFIRVLDEVGMPHPPAKIFQEREAIEQAFSGRCFLKLSMSTAGGGVRQVRDRNELGTVLDEFSARGYLNGSSDIVMQDPVEGENCGCYGVFSHGKLLASHCVRLRLDNRGGWFTAVEGVDHPGAIESMEAFGRHLQWHGAIALEYFRDANSDSYYFIECNPRIGETYNATVSGVNICEQLVKVSLGQVPDPIYPSSIGRKTHQSFLVLMAQAVAGGGRGRLLRELGRQLITGSPLYRDSVDELTQPWTDPWSIIPRIAVTSQLLVAPGSGQRMVDRTVTDYALSEQAVEKIREGAF